MCIIAAKPAGIAMPSDTIIRNMWEHNSDGAGFMYADHGHVHIEKGFMSLKAFMDALDAVRAKQDLTNTGVVLHFRIATHGGVNQDCTHPFPVTDNMATLRKTMVNANIGMAHNGIIHSVTPRDKRTSDTMEFIASVVTPIYKSNHRFYTDKNMMQLLDTLAGSKLAFLLSDGSIHTVGHFHEEDGIMYSNYSYESYQSFNSSYPYSSNIVTYPDNAWDTTGSMYDWDNGWDDYITRKYLMPLCDVDGAFFVTTKDNTMCEDKYGDIAIDANGGVWLWDDMDDIFYPDYGERIKGVYAQDGTPLRFDGSLATEAKCFKDDEDYMYESYGEGK